MSGRVYLVGAGPGDPGLLTLRGRECIAEADVILCDDLVDRRVLRHARADATVVASGKRGGPADRDRQQEAIHERMIAEARAGRVVVRLKGGDPFVFGRGGEEAARLGEAGIPFEVVPGVTSAIAAAAYAGIPVTHRGAGASFAVVTGQEAPGLEGRVDWEALARIETLVILMGFRRIAEVTARLVGAGRAAETPAACVAAGTRPDQRTVVATLGTLAERAVAEGLGSPAVIVVGDVVRLRERLRWFENRPLLGRRIVVTRPPGQAQAFRERLERLGAETIEAPAITIEPSPDPDAFDAALAALDRFDWIVFTSANGVEAFFARLFGRGGEIRDLGRAALAAIGPATAEALRRRGLRVETVPEEFRAEGLSAALGARVSGARVLLPRAAGARDVLPRVLAEAGADVVDVPTYTSRPASSLPDEVREDLAAGRIDAVTFTSSSTVSAFVPLLRAVGLTFGRAAVACIGPVTAATARELGLVVDVEARRYTSEGLAEALVDYYRGGS